MHVRCENDDGNWHLRGGRFGCVCYGSIGVAPTAFAYSDKSHPRTFHLLLNLKQCSVRCELFADKEMDVRCPCSSNRAPLSHTRLFTLSHHRAELENPSRLPTTNQSDLAVS